MALLWTKDKNKKNARISSAGRAFLLSGEDVYEATQIIQALQPALDLTDMHIEGLQIILDRYARDGGEISKEDTESGFDAVYRFGAATVRVHYGAGGEGEGMSIDLATPPSGGDADLAAVSRAYDAARTVAELPRRRFVREELQRLVRYIENDNALRGLRHVKDILGNEASIVYQAVTAVEEDAPESAPDLSDLLKAVRP